MNFNFTIDFAMTLITTQKTLHYAHGINHTGYNLVAPLMQSQSWSLCREPGSEHLLLLMYDMTLVIWVTGLEAV